MNPVCVEDNESVSKDEETLLNGIHSIEIQLGQDITTQRGQSAGYIDTVQTMQESVTRHSVTMDEIQLRQDILDVKTANGTFIWKIPDIQRRLRDAQDKRTLSLYSPPFHTSPHHGYGGGGLESLSLSFIVMKSEHDDLLKWPFDQTGTVELVNKKENRACKKHPSPSKDEISNSRKISSIPKSSAEVFKAISSELSSTLSPSSFNSLLIPLWSNECISKELKNDLVSSSKDHSLKCAQLIGAVHSTLEIFPEKLHAVVKVFQGIDDPALKKLSLKLSCGFRMSPKSRYT